MAPDAQHGGAPSAPGPAVCWIRLRYPIVADTSLSPLQRILAAADFGNGVSSVLPWNQNFSSTLISR